MQRLRLRVRGPGQRARSKRPTSLEVAPLRLYTHTSAADNLMAGFRRIPVFPKPCRAYQLAKATGDSDLYYEGKTFTEPGKPNAFLQYAGDRITTYAPFCGRGSIQGAGVGVVSRGAAGLPAGAAKGCSEEVGAAIVRNNVNEPLSIAMDMDFTAND